MRSTVGLEVMNSINLELNWKFMTKGKRSRKSVPRSFNGVSKVGKISPKRVGDFSGSDSDKLALSVLGQLKAHKSEHVPIKKRRHLLGSTAPLHCQDSRSPQPNSSLQPSENQVPDQFLHSKYSLGKRSLNSHSNLQLTGVDELARAKSDKGFNNGTLSKRADKENYSGDFSGIELLAAAASMEDCADNANKEDSADNTNKVDCAVEDYSIPGSSDASIVVSLSKRNESGNSSSTRTICADSANCLPVLNKCAATSLSPCVSSKMDRRYWDLNTEIDAWGEPYDDSISGNTSKDSAGCKTHVEGLKECSEELPNPAVVGNESFALKREDKLGVTPDRTSCTDSTSLEEHLVKPEKISHSSVAGETSNQSLTKDGDENNSNQVVSSDADVGTPRKMMSTDGNRVFDSVQAMIKDADIPGAAVSASKIVVPDKNAINSQNSYKAQGNVISLRKTISYATCRREYSHKSNSNPDEMNCFSSLSKFGHSSGSFLEDEKCVVVADYTVQNDETCVTGSMITESRSQVQPEKLVVKHEDNGLSNEGLGRVMLEDSCNSYSTRPYEDRAASVGKVDNTIDPCPESPYEDGELRELFLYSWKENELETELVDYESDGRKGESSDAADNIASEIVEGASEGSHGTEGNRGQSKAVEYPPRRNFAKDDYKKNVTCGKKESNGGFGTTVDHSMEMVIDENNDSMKRRDFNRTGMDDCKALMGEYVSRMAREKLQSRIEGRSSLEAADGKDAFFLPQYRSRRLGGFRDRDGTPEKYVGKYTPTTCSSGRDGVNQWNDWVSRSRYTSNYQGTEGYNGTRPRRNITGDSVEKFGVLDFHEQRQTADYLSRDMHRPLVRTRSAEERDHRFSMGKKMPPTRRINSYRSSAHYPQSGGFEPAPNGPAAPVHFSRMPRTERSFSPNPVKDGHMPSNRRSRSRSRTRSPRAWHSYRDSNFASKRHSRSPDFRTEARMGRVNLPFHKPTFTREYREGYMSPSRGRFSPQRNSRWVDDRNVAENRFKHRRSPTGGFRCNNQSFNSVNSSDRLKADEYFRPVIRPRRFSFVENDVRETKFETIYDDRKLENKWERYRGKQRDNGGNFKRFQREVINDFETRKSNNEEGVCCTVPTGVPRVQGDRKESEI